MPKCDFNKVVLQLYWNRTLAWCSPVNFLHIFRTLFLKNTSGRLLLHFSSGMFISKNVGTSYAFFQRYYNYFWGRLAAINSFNRIIYFSNIRIWSHWFLPTFLKFFTPVTVNQTLYRNSSIFREATIILKWEQPLFWSNYFSTKKTFSEHLVFWSGYFFLIATSW